MGFFYVLESEKTTLYNKFRKYTRRNFLFMEDNEKKLDAVEEAQVVSELSNKVAKLEAENAELTAAKKKYYDRLLNNNDPEPEQKVMHTPEEIQALREKLFTSENQLTNLEYTKTALELRDAVLEQTDGKTDIFVGKGSKFAPTQEDYFRAQNTAETLKECVEYADGDSQIFTQEVQRRLSGR